MKSDDACYKELEMDHQWMLMDPAALLRCAKMNNKVH